MMKLPKIHRLGTTYTQYVLNGPVEITGKLDGSQFRIYKPSEGSLLYGSRSVQFNQTDDFRYIGKQFLPAIDIVEKDNDGILKEELLQCLPVGTTLFAEYIGRLNKHKILYNEQKALRVFCYYYNGNWYPPDWINMKNLDYVPFLIKKSDVTVAKCMDIIDNMTLEDKLEGIVIKNYDPNFPNFGDRFAKLVLPEFKEVKSDKFPIEQKDLKLEAQFLNFTITSQRIEKIIWCIPEEERTWGMDMMPKVIPLILEDIIREELPDFVLEKKPQKLDFGHIRKGIGRLAASLLKEILYERMRNINDR